MSSTQCHSTTCSSFSTLALPLLLATADRFTSPLFTFFHMSLSILGFNATWDVFSLPL